MGTVGPRVTEGRGRKVADTSHRHDDRTANWRIIAEGGRSGGGAMIEVEQSPQPLGFANGAFPTGGSLVREGDDVIESLMIAFVLIGGQILRERVTQRTLAKEDQLIQAFILHGTHPTFRKGVEVG